MSLILRFFHRPKPPWRWNRRGFRWTFTAVSQSILKQLPPGTTAPLVIQYSASTVPVLQWCISSSSLSEQQTYDIALSTIRVALISVPGVGIPLPYGGKQRVISVGLDPKALEAQNLSEQDVVIVLTRGNLVFPSGTAKIGPNEYPIDLNTSPRLTDRLNGMPIKTVDGAVIRVHDVAQVRDGYMPQQNVVRQDGASYWHGSWTESLKVGGVRQCAAKSVAPPRRSSQQSR